MKQTIAILAIITILLIPVVQSMSTDLALKLAIIRSDPEAVRNLLENGADPNALDIIGKPPLQHLIMSQESIKTDTEIVKLLIDAGADVNYAESRWGLTPLLYVCSKINDVEIVKLLLESGADPNAADIDGLAPLMYVFRGSIQTDLYYPEQQLELIELLISYGADARATDHSGKTIVDHASSRKTLALRKKLLQDLKRHQKMEIQQNLKDSLKRYQ